MAGPRRKGGDGPSDATRRRIVEAALETLKTEGFSGASARAIARTGDFNQALIFYHFGTVNNLLLAALDETSGRRMARYREAVADVGTLPALLEVATGLYREDLGAGHITVLAELIAGSVTHPDLRAEIAKRVDPWVDLTRDAIDHALAGSALVAVLPVADLAFAIVALYLGIEMLTHLDTNAGRAESLFSAGQQGAALLGSLMGATTGARR